MDVHSICSCEDPILRFDTGAAPDPGSWPGSKLKICEKSEALARWHASKSPVCRHLSYRVRQCTVRAFVRAETESMLDTRFAPFADDNAPFRKMDGFQLRLLLKVRVEMCAKRTACAAVQSHNALHIRNRDDTSY